MMFSSGKHQQLEINDGVHFTPHLAAERGQPVAPVTHLTHPRNRVLAAVREAPSIPAATWLGTALLRGELPMAAYTPAEVEHASRVLTRVQALSLSSEQVAA